MTDRWLLNALNLSIADAVGNPSPWPASLSKRLFDNSIPFKDFSPEGEEILERGLPPPSLTYTPPSLIKGRGQGDRLLNNLREAY